jgi:hypothetical protein
MDRYMSPEALSQCVRQAEEKGWNGGVMYWEWNSVSQPSIAKSTALTKKDTPRIMATTLS